MLKSAVTRAENSIHGEPNSASHLELSTEGNYLLDSLSPAEDSPKLLKPKDKSTTRGKSTA